MSENCTSGAWNSARLKRTPVDAGVRAREKVLSRRTINELRFVPRIKIFTSIWMTTVEKEMVEMERKAKAEQN